MKEEKMKLFLLGISCLPLTLLAQAPAPTQEQEDFFENRVRPVLAQNCFACHTNSQMGGLRLDSLEGLLKGGKSGPAVVPGAPEKSMMVTAIRQTTEIKMPKNGHLTEAQIADLTAWVKEGAVWPVEKVTAQARRVCHPAGTEKLLVLPAAGKARAAQDQGRRVAREQHR